nr:hypothetical protein [Dehalococcoides mccartyi]
MGSPFGLSPATLRTFRYPVAAFPPVEYPAIAICLRPLKVSSDTWETYSSSAAAKTVSMNIAEAPSNSGSCMATKRIEWRLKMRE